jgi:hypothetical protein
LSEKIDVDELQNKFFYEEDKLFQETDSDENSSGDENYLSKKEQALEKNPFSK